jgi:Ca-activated chloride channel homolog
MSALMRRASSATPLSRSTLSIAITDLVAEYTLRHVFSNRGKNPIEIVYSFPVPLDAAFLGLTATVAGQALAARVQLKAKAEHEYDDAIAEGHSAVLLSAPEPGLLCVNLGNLKPDEEGEIVLRFATSLRVADGCARLNLPLTHRPRYGKWRLDDLSTPRHDFAVEHPLSLDICVTGLLGASHARCLSHPAAFHAKAEQQVLQLDDALMDRDVAVVFELSEALQPTARCVADGEATLGMISIPVPSDDTYAQPLDLVLLLDCSGSMQGDAIAQSQSALNAVAKAFSPEDRIQIIRFGSTCQPVFRRPLKATPLVCASIRELIPLIQSDMGGTEMGAALDSAQRHIPASTSGRRRAIILITDGAVQPADIADQQKQLSASGIPTFVVAVGSTAGVEVLRPLAEKTLALLERAVPMEPIDACVMRLFRRASKAPVSANVKWPEGLEVELIPMSLAFPGEVLTFAARWIGPTTGEVRIGIASPETALKLPLTHATSDPAIRALLGQRRVAAATRKDQARLAVDYGLLTEETSAILVRWRASDDRVEVMPEIVSVPQMVSEGMAGMPRLSLSCGNSFNFYSMPALRSPPELDGIDMFCPSDRLGDPAFEEEDSSEASIEPRVEVQTLPPIPADRIKEVVLALNAILATAYLTTSRTSPNLETVVHALPEHLREDAFELLKSLGIWPSDEFESAIALLLAMVRLAITPDLPDNEEARIPLLVIELQARDSTMLSLHIELGKFVESGLTERELIVPSRAD